MKPPFSVLSSKTYRALAVTGICILMALVFIADTITNYAIAAAVFHTPLLLIAIRFLSARQVITLASFSMVLTVVSVLLTRSGDYEVGLVNTGISLVAIVITTYLGLKLKSVQAAAHETREHLLRLSRVTTLGQLSTSIAHEVSQPLAAINSSAGACLRWLQASPPNVEKAQAAAQRIVYDAQRAKDVLDRVRSITRNEAPSSSAFDLNLALTELLSLSGGQMQHQHIDLRLALQSDLPQVFADRVQVQQVMANLLLNAIEALSPTSDYHAAHITIETRVLPSDKPQANTVLFSIKDNGPGLSGTQLSHLFDTFWTTKAGGLGLGLTISRSIIDANNGHIWATEPADGGAAFHFTLPLAP
ncbi:sensor histidine kinase [Alcaligenes faecalis]|uniref:sensor histidine kinase n=1 Tax=Alcaligenes faecalis TaxID=511 RepID=UPI0029335635|nr:ATP-binding protein [Alcaligenes faecalis]MDV2117253.1 ATP-binding protein [Alcaligenes faecalis]